MRSSGSSKRWGRACRPLAWARASEYRGSAGHAAVVHTVRRTGRICATDDRSSPGLTRDGGFASHVVASSDFSFALKGFDDPVAAAPLLCAGLIGWRSLKLCGDAHRIGLYGFRRCRPTSSPRYADGRGGRFMPSPGPGDLRGAGACSLAGHNLGRQLQRSSAASPRTRPSCSRRSGDLVPAALKVVRKGGRVV